MLLHLLGQHVVTMCVHTLAHQEAMLGHKHHKTLIVTILSRETHSQSSWNCREVWKYQGTCVSQYFLLWYCTNSQKHRFVSAASQLGLWTVPNRHLYVILQKLSDVDTKKSCSSIHHYDQQIPSWSRGITAPLNWPTHSRKHCFLWYTWNNPRKIFLHTCRHLNRVNWVGENVTSFPHLLLVS